MFSFCKFLQHFSYRIPKSFVDSQNFPTENEGNCLRFLALQAESKAAMRKLLDSMPHDFNKKWSDFDKFCKTKKGKSLTS